jgi:hypothetical protein
MKLTYNQKLVILGGLIVFLTCSSIYFQFRVQYLEVENETLYRILYHTLGIGVTE